MKVPSIPPLSDAIAENATNLVQKTNNLTHTPLQQQEDGQSMSKLKVEEQNITLSEQQIDSAIDVPIVINSSAEIGKEQIAQIQQPDTSVRDTLGKVEVAEINPTNGGMSKLNQEIYSIAMQSAASIVSAQTNQLKEEFEKQIKQQEERVAKLIESLVKRK